MGSRLKIDVCRAAGHRRHRTVVRSSLSAL